MRVNQRISVTVFFLPAAAQHIQIDKYKLKISTLKAKEAEQIGRQFIEIEKKRAIPLKEQKR